MTFKEYLFENALIDRRIKAHKIATNKIAHGVKNDDEIVRSSAISRPDLNKLRQVLKQKGKDFWPWHKNKNWTV